MYLRESGKYVNELGQAERRPRFRRGGSQRKQSPVKLSAVRGIESASDVQIGLTRGPPPSFPPLPPPSLFRPRKITTGIVSMRRRIFSSTPLSPPACLCSDTADHGAIIRASNTEFVLQRGISSRVRRYGGARDWRISFRNDRWNIYICM